uniref:Uncharacterized protein n=1 Tax=Nelumbo nucifera TaxID=4432 RepID=A0A822Z1C5_NELNU|nr:TPA_asm: hypothetical protein HUJ06_008954 [Nelumbo nucifera]
MENLGIAYVVRQRMTESLWFRIRASAEKEVVDRNSSLISLLFMSH